MDITSALSSVRDAKLAKEVLDQALGPKGFVRAQDLMRWIALFLRNFYTREVAWDFMIKHWDWIEATLADSKSLDYLPTYSAAIVSTQEWAKKYHTFFDPKKDIKILQRNIKLGSADIEARVAWRKRDELPIKAWLKANATARPKSS